MEQPTLKRDFEFFLAQRAELSRDHPDTFVAIKDEKVLGFYPDAATALRETAKDHEVGTFIVQHVSADPSSYQQTFHSRVSVRC